MNMDTLVKQSFEASAKIMGISYEEALDNQEARNIAFKLSCVAMSEESITH